MEVLEVVLAALGVLGLIIGYRRNSRNLLLLSALVLSTAFGLVDFASGVYDGWQQSTARRI